MTEPSVSAVPGKSVRSERDAFVCRPFVIRDLPACLEAMRLIWFSYEEEPLWLRKLSNLQYMLSCMGHSTDMLVAADRNTDRPAGFIILQRKNEPLSGLSKICKALHSVLHAVLSLLPQARDGQAFSDRYRDNYAVLGTHAPQHREKTAEFVLLIVHPSAQGKGLGRLLIAEAEKLLQQKGISHCFLLTDENCNYPLYDHLGFERTYTEHMDFSAVPEHGTYAFNCFVYEWDLPDLKNQAQPKAGATRS